MLWPTAAAQYAFLSPIGWGSSCGSASQRPPCPSCRRFCPLSVGVRPAARVHLPGPACLPVFLSPIGWGSSCGGISEWEWGHSFYLFLSPIGWGSSCGLICLPDRERGFKRFLSPIGWGSSCGFRSKFWPGSPFLCFCPLSVGVRPAAPDLRQRERAVRHVSVPYRLGFVLRR